MGCGGSKDVNANARNKPNKNSGRGKAGKTGSGNAGRRKNKVNHTPVNEKGYKKRIRENMRNAAAGDDVEQLEKCMEIFINNHLEDAGDYSEAERRLDFLQTRKEIRDACMRDHPVILDKAIQKVEASPYKRQLKPYLDRAYYLKQHQDQLERYRHDISNMEQSTISEIRSYHHPPPGVHETMIATYMVLGYPENHLVDWTEITALMGRYGRDSLIREVTVADPSQLDKKVGLRARMYLGQYTLEEVRSVSTGAAAFHVWSSQMVGAGQGKKGSSAGSTPLKLTNSRGKGQQPQNKSGSQTPNSTTKPNDASKSSAKPKDNKQNKSNTQNKGGTKANQNTPRKNDPKAASTKSTKKG